MTSTGTKLAIQRAQSVQEDWLAWLPAEKDGLFESTVASLEKSYSILSVALEDSFCLCDDGALIPAREQVGISADFFDRLCGRITKVLQILGDHGRHCGTLPNCVPLSAQFFRGEISSRLARKNALLHRVLLSSRSRFFYKIQILSETIEALQKEYRSIAEELSQGLSVRPAFQWRTLEILHYDLNTCLRETTVVLKSFLCALPDAEVTQLRRKLLSRSRQAVPHRRLTRF